MNPIAPALTLARTSSGKYLVTGGREVTTTLTVHADGKWELADGATLYAVTHLPCRTARYTTAAGSEPSS